MTAEGIDEILKKVTTGQLSLNVCKVFPYLHNTNILKKDSASPSEIMFGKLVIDSMKLNTEVSLKIFLDINSSNPNYQQDIQGIKYEARVYGDIINAILVKNQSPNFIGLLGYGECNYFQTNKDDKKFNQLKGDLYKKASKWGLEDYQDEKGGSMSNQLSKEKKLGILITNKPKGELFTLTELYERNISHKSKIIILFQIIYSLAVMQQYRLVHNDLHPGNILVSVLDQEVEYVYVYKGKVFKIKTRYIPYLFDWDLAYSDFLGDNPKIESDYFCKDMNICNRFSKKMDIYILLCYLKNFSNTTNIDDIGKGLVFNVSFGKIQYVRKTSKPYYVKYNRVIYRMPRQEFRTVFGQSVMDKIGDKLNADDPVVMFSIINNNHIMFYSRVNQLADYVNKEDIWFMQEDQMNRLKRYKPYVNNIYKMGRKQLHEVFGPKIFNAFPGLSSLMFKIVDKDKIQLYNKHYCRPTGFSKHILTPKEWLEGNTFAKFRVNKFSDVARVPKKNIFKFPMESIIPKVYIDPFRKQKTTDTYGSKYVKTLDRKPDQYLLRSMKEEITPELLGKVRSKLGRSQTIEYNQPRVIIKEETKANPIIKPKRAINPVRPKKTVSSKDELLTDEKMSDLDSPSQGKVAIKSSLSPVQRKRKNRPQVTVKSSLSPIQQKRKNRPQITIKRTPVQGVERKVSDIPSPQDDLLCDENMSDIECELKKNSLKRGRKRYGIQTNRNSPFQKKYK